MDKPTTPGHDETVAYLSDSGLHAVTTLAARAFWVVPILLIVMKIGDRCLDNLSSDGFLWCVGSGFFGKLDDLTFAVTLSGTAACSLVAAAAVRLQRSKAPLESGWPIRRKQLRAWAGLVLMGLGLYLFGTYVTNGTFWNASPKTGRLFQVPEGLLNVALIVFVYGYVQLGRQAIIAVEHRVRNANGAPLSEDTRLAAEYLINVTFSFIIATAIIAVAVLSLYGATEALSRLSSLSWISLRKQFGIDPLSGIRDELVKMAFVVAVMYWPLLFFAWRMRKVLPSSLKWKLNAKVEFVLAVPSLTPTVKFKWLVPRLVVITLVQLDDASTADGTSGRKTEPSPGKDSEPALVVSAD